MAALFYLRYGCKCLLLLAGEHLEKQYCHSVIASQNLNGETISNLRYNLIEILCVS